MLQLTMAYYVDQTDVEPGLSGKPAEGRLCRPMGQGAGEHASGFVGGVG